LEIINNVFKFKKHLIQTVLIVLLLIYHSKINKKLKVNFDIQAKDWDNDPKKVERAKILAEEIKQYFNKEKLSNAFEFGCGTGLVSYFLKDFFNTITLADNSKGMIGVLKEKIEKEKLVNLNPILIDMLEDDVHIEKQDMIYTLLTIHHIHDLNKIFAGFNNILKPGGYLCIADLVSEDGSFHAKYPDFDGHNGFAKNDLTVIIENNGFKLESYKIFHIIEKQFENETREYPLFLMIGKKIN
jgi:predicted TPR repeat methyltransferase